MLSILGVMLSFFGSYTKKMTYFKWAEMLAFLLFRDFTQNCNFPKCVSMRFLGCIYLLFYHALHFETIDIFFTIEN